MAQGQHVENANRLKGAGERFVFIDLPLKHTQVGANVAMAMNDPLRLARRARRVEDLYDVVRVNLGDLEIVRLIEALDAEAWNQSRAARRLGVTETRVRNLMRRHGLRPRNRRGRPRKAAESRSA